MSYFQKMADQFLILIFYHCCRVVIVVIEDVFGTEVFGIYADFTKGPRVFEEIKELLTGFEIGVLGMCLLGDIKNHCHGYCVKLNMVIMVLYKYFIKHLHNKK